MITITINKSIAVLWCSRLQCISAQCDPIADCQNNKVHFLKRLMCREELVGAVYLLGNIYVIVKESFHVLVYTGHSPYSLKDKIFLSGMIASDIATSYTDICVYVLDNGNSRVWRIGQNHSVVPFIEGLERWNLKRMSVTKDGQLIIVLNSSEIVTYGRDGSLIDVLYFPSSHAVEVATGIVVGDDSAVTKITKEGYILDTLVGFCCRYGSMDRDENVIACDWSRHRVVELDSKSLQVTATLLTLDRDGIERPQHVQYVLENGMLLVCWMNFLDVYSFRQKATQGYLASSENDSREQQTLEAEILEREIRHNDTFKDLVGLYRRSGMDCIFNDFPLEPAQESELSSVGEFAMLIIFTNNCRISGIRFVLMQ